MVGKETSMLHVTPRARNGQRAKVVAKEVCGAKTRARRKKTYAHACRTRMSHYVPASSRCHVATKPPPPHARLHPLSTQVQGRRPSEPARKKTETRNKAEAGKKCMTGRRVEERVKSNEATKGTRGSQRPSKGRAQGRGHGRHTASTTPHRDT